MSDDGPVSKAVAAAFRGRSISPGQRPIFELVKLYARTVDRYEGLAEQAASIIADDQDMRARLRAVETKLQSQSVLVTLGKTLSDMLIKLGVETTGSNEGGRGADPAADELERQRQRRGRAARAD